MDNFMIFLQTFAKLFGELVVLFIVISFTVSWLQRIVSEERIQRVLDRPNKWSGYLYALLFGAITPFCSCSTIPVLAGLFSARAPFGPTITFLIASPILGPIFLVVLWTLLGWKLTILYIVFAALFSLVVGFLWKTFGFQNLIKEVRVKKRNPHQLAATLDSTQTMSNWKFAFLDAWSFFLSMLPYLFIGVLLGSAIYGFIPERFIAKYIGTGEFWTIPVAAIIGAPMYIREEVMLPIANVLLSKGMGVGTIIALLIGGAGCSIPEVIMLKKLFKPKLLIAFILSVLVVATATGVAIQLIL